MQRARPTAMWRVPQNDVRDSDSHPGKISVYVLPFENTVTVIAHMEAVTTVGARDSAVPSSRTTPCV